MSIASKISTLSTLTNNIKAKLRSWGLLPTPAGTDTQGLDDCYNALNAIHGTQIITGTGQVNVLGNGKQYAQVSDPDLIPENIVSGKTILGVAGTAGQATNIDYDELYIAYGSEKTIEGVYRPDDYGCDYFSEVTLEELPNSNAGKTLLPKNIKKGVTILGVNGDLDFASWDTAHSGYFSQQALEDNPNLILHGTQPESLSFPLGVGTNPITWLGRGDLQLEDIEYMVVDCNQAEGELLPSDEFNIIGVEYQRDVYGSLGYVLVFKAIRNGRYFRLYSRNATLSIEYRTITHFGVVYPDVLCLKVSAIPEDEGDFDDWLLIDCHNSLSMWMAQTIDLLFYDNLLYHIDVKFTHQTT